MHSKVIVGKIKEIFFYAFPFFLDLFVCKWPKYHACSESVMEYQQFKRKTGFDDDLQNCLKKNFFLNHYL